MAVIHIYRYIFIPLSLHSPNNINRILSATESKQQGDRCELIIFVDFKVVKIPRLRILIFAAVASTTRPHRPHMLFVVEKGLY